MLSRKLCCWLLPASLIAAAAICTSAAAQVALTGDFDHGALASWSGDSASLQLVGRDNYYGSGRWRWLYFKASGIQGASPTFSISSNFAGDSTPGLHELAEHEMVYSYDNEHWQFFDNNQLGAAEFSFSNATPFTQDEVYVAYALPYSYGRSVTHTQSVLQSPWAAPTASGNAAGVIGSSTPGVDELGRATPALDVFGYRITNPATDSGRLTKQKIVISSGLHAGEPLGTYVYQGMVDWLLSDDPRAAWVRDNVEVYGYPVLNPSGRIMGTNRTTVNNIGRDPNGLWDPNRWSSSSYGCGGDDCQEIRATGEAMMADVTATQGGVDAFIDFHSTVPDYQIDEVNGVPDDFAYINSDDLGADWWEAFRLLQPNVLQEVSGGGSYTTAGFARRRLGAEVEITFETQFTWERNTDYYLGLGANFGVSFYNAWAPGVPGDFNADGLVDAADYTVWRDSYGAVGAALPADANSDQVVDAADLESWRANFGVTATTPTVAVPTPNAATCLTVLAAVGAAAPLLRIRFGFAAGRS
ncbi:Zinc carboxypeptidase [Posidoniimonas polymericola]|uniref:Zinc carboxypeptidase n=1 Tax=Posidoniimonas polymericola TaxID=2528002 RepID=A0A5C5YBE2_9BACT|nr:M14 family zinc carboxypeptidase [Posidoniimonas polymericola]TWT72700.1 Zinc carboxypeptidase [Posidoniimonas polymericola]